MNSTDSRQRTVPVTCSTKHRTMTAGSLTGCASTLATSGTRGGLTATSASAAAIASAAGCISAQWNGAETGSIIARFTPCAFAISTARSTADFSPDNTTCPPPLSLAAAQTPAPVGVGGNRFGVVEFNPDKRGHGANADRHRLLHGAATNAQKPGRVSDGERRAAASAEYSPSE